MIKCGLYKTTEPIAEHEAVEAGLLVYFHNHSDAGTPIVLLPQKNEHNRWSFPARGFSIKDEAYLATLVSLKPEGLYRVTEHFHPDDSSVVATDSLVQLGYNRAAEPILFFPQRVEDANGMSFPSKGTRVPPSIYELLAPLSVSGPVPQRKLH